MSTDTQLRLAASRTGRVFIHVIMFAKDHRWASHSQGIWRKISRQGVANPFAMKST